MLGVVPVLLCAVVAAHAMVYFVSPRASLGDRGRGTLAEPWTLAHVLAGKTRVQPGDTVRLLPGLYSHALHGSAALDAEARGDAGAARFHCRGWAGASGKPVTFEAADTLPAIIDVASVWNGDDDADVHASFSIDCDHTRWRRLQFTNSHSTTTTTTTALQSKRQERACVVVSAPNVELEQIHVFDCLAGVRLSRDATTVTLHHSIFSNIGWRVLNSSVQAHAVTWTLDAPRDTGAAERRVVERNVFHNVGNCGVMIQAARAAVTVGRLSIEDNVFANEQTHGCGVAFLVGSTRLFDVIVRRNQDFRLQRSLVFDMDARAATMSPKLTVAHNTFQHEVESPPELDRSLWRGNAARFGDLDVLITADAHCILVTGVAAHSGNVTVFNTFGNATLDVVNSVFGMLERVKTTAELTPQVHIGGKIGIVVVRPAQAPPVVPTAARIGSDPSPRGATGDCDVVISGDRSQFVPMLAAINSALKHSARVRVHVLLTGATGDAASFGAQAACLLGESAFRRVSVVPFELDDQRLFRFAIGDTDKNSGARNLSSPHNFVRFYLPTLLPRLQKAIWIDADVILLADVCMLFDAALLTDRYELGAVVRYRSYVSDEREKFDLSPASPLLSVRPELARCRAEHCFHFNAGVTVMRLDLWRRRNTTQQLERLVTFLGAHPSAALGLTQPPMILHFWDNVEEIDMRWNMAHAARVARRLSADARQQSELDTAFLLHFNGALKPWNVKEGTPLHNVWAKWAVARRSDCP
jgi:lipopolysaccharide biosynthesis glycosyltransferase